MSVHIISSAYRTHLQPMSDRSSVLSLDVHSWPCVIIILWATVTNSQLHMTAFLLRVQLTLDVKSTDRIRALTVQTLTQPKTHCQKDSRSRIFLTNKCQKDSRSRIFFTYSTNIVKQNLDRESFCQFPVKKILDRESFCTLFFFGRWLMSCAFWFDVRI